MTRQLARSEELGYESAWVTDTLFSDVDALEPFTLLSWAAAQTSRMRLGVSVLVLPRLSPVHVAKMTACLDQLSGGRLLVGVGIGREFGLSGAFGHGPERRVTRFEEGIEIVKKLWTEPTVTYEGHFYKLNDARIEPKPAQKPRPPLWFGGHAVPAMRRAVRFGDGWMGAGSARTARFRKSLAELREMLHEAGRDEAHFSISKRVYIAVDDDEQRALERLNAWLRNVYGDYVKAENVCVYGSAQRCAEQLAEIVAEEPEMIFLNPVFDFMDQTDRLAQDVLPRLGEIAG